MPKEVSFSAKPKIKANVDNWVENREVPTTLEANPQLAAPEVAPTMEEPSQPKIKRLTLDISEALHKKIKVRAVIEGISMVEMLRELLETTYE
jgi:predicted DNA binding CopG/RHH family protein